LVVLGWWPWVTRGAGAVMKCQTRSQMSNERHGRGIVRIAAAMIAGGFLVGLGGCAMLPPRSSALSADDIVFTAAELATKLRGSDFLKERGPESERMVVAIHRVENLTTDIIPESDQWFLMAKVRDSESMRVLAAQKNIRFVIPAEQLARAKRVGALPDEAALARNPTHEMTATFRSATRAAGLDRTDAYQCECRITSIGDGALAWVDVVEFKKVAFGRSYD
jgi:hypothetical protein